MTSSLLRQYHLPTEVGLAILVGCLGFLALALGFEGIAALILLPGLVLAAPLALVISRLTLDPIATSVILSGAYALPILAWWLIIRGSYHAIRSRRSLRGDQ